MRCSRNALAQRGRKLLARKSSVNLAVCAMARRLTVAVWHVMKGRWTTVQEIQAALKLKVGKMISQVGAAGLKQLGKTRKAFREEIFQSLKTGKVYVLYPPRKFTQKAAIKHPLTLAQEYGLR